MIFENNKIFLFFLNFWIFFIIYVGGGKDMFKYVEKNVVAYCVLL